MRATIHLVSARDALEFRALIAPVFERVFATRKWVEASGGLDPVDVMAAARELIEERPRTRAQLLRLLEERWPDVPDEADLSRVVFLLGIVQVPPRGVWGQSGQATLTTVESWLGRSMPQQPSVEALVLRYLGAFGPATVADVQNWSRLTRLAEVVDRLRPQLATFRNEDGRELFDLPGAPRPDPDTPAPVRFLPEYDNLLLGHDDRSRVIEGDWRTPLFPGNGSQMGTVLLDGFFRAMWRIVREGDAARLVVEPLARISKRDAAAVRAEGRRLLAFTAGERRVARRPGPTLAVVISTNQFKNGNHIEVDGTDLQDRSSSSTSSPARAGRSCARSCAARATAP